MTPAKIARKAGAGTLTGDARTGQSLARGTVATALLHVERAWTGIGTWSTAHAHIQAVTAGPVDAADHVGLYYGAPAIAFLLRTAADRHPAYRRAAEALDEHVRQLTCRRLAAATTRIEHIEPASFAEYDLFHGLVGIGALLLCQRLDGDGLDILTRILRYVVTMTIQPHQDDGISLPGWWVGHDPDETRPTPGGHLNFGIAHGGAGLLAFLALATQAGHVVEGQHDAMGVLMGWFDRWRQDGPDGSWWPQWITRGELLAGRPSQAGPGRPSWCYGLVGIGRALQLAALATGDLRRQEAVEDALAAGLTDAQLDRMTEAGVCHGLAGIYQTIYRAARDARTSAIARRLPALAARLTQQAGDADGDGLLTGHAGVALVLETAQQRTPPRTGWDACLLIT